MRTALAASCQGSALGQNQTSALSTGVTLLAPATVKQGADFQVELTADPIVVPTTGGGYSIARLSAVSIRFNLPAGATFKSATLSGGSLLGSGVPSVASSGGLITLTVPGNLSPGTTAILPKVTATLNASGAVGTSLPAQLHGTSYSDPGISFTATVSGVPLFGNLDVPTKCFASPNPVLGTTTIN